MSEARTMPATRPFRLAALSTIGALALLLSSTSRAAPPPDSTTVDATQHALFGFPLVGAHTPGDCAACHPKGRFKGTPKTCGGCHKDVHKGRLGPACERCHFEDGWKDVGPFDHARETGLPLDKPHDKPCAACHGADGRALDGKQPTHCGSCHSTTGPRGHGPSFGTNCTACHQPSKWTGVKPFDHRATHFPLDRRHAVTACNACHKTGATQLSPECRTCHGDPHRGRALLDCGECHRADSWLVIRFDHDRTEFPLNGLHFLTSCRYCHTADVWAGLPHECVFCHRGDKFKADVNVMNHRAKAPPTCGDCHKPANGWRSSVKL